MKHEQIIIKKTATFVKKAVAKNESCHDWWHIYRVWNLSKKIAKTEKVNIFVVELGALLHDIADSKLHHGDETVGPRKARQFLESLKVNKNIIAQVESIVANISYKGEKHEQKFISPELNVVQDADRLDAIGAIGIARTFSFGGYKGRTIYDPKIKPKLGMNNKKYKNNNGTTINHFYEKLLLLKDRMNTNYGKRLAIKRHKTLEQFLDKFFKELKNKE